jgi:hypothetical protein
VSRIARWSGTAWLSLGTGLSGPAHALAILGNGDLVAGGNFLEAGGVSSARIARWDGSTWSSFGNGMNGSVNALCVRPDGRLVAAGAFTAVDGVSARLIAQWDGVGWTALGTGLGNTVWCVSPTANGDLAVGGNFVSAGGAASHFWAYWTDTGVPSAIGTPGLRSEPGDEPVLLEAKCPAGFDFDGTLAFQWRRNGADLVDGPGGASAGGGIVTGARGSLSGNTITTELQIVAATASDAGQYSVVFSNACGDSESAPVVIVVEAVCAGDLNADLEVGGSDLGVLLGAWGTDGGATGADLDDSGVVSGADLGLLLSAWGPCSE